MAQHYAAMRLELHPLAAREINFLLNCTSNRHLMRRHCVTSVLLMVVLAVSTSACAMDRCSGRASFCAAPRVGRDCARSKIDTAANTRKACQPVVQSMPASCSLRSLGQFQFLAFDRCEICAPLRSVGGMTLARPDSRIIVSSIGSPETDRGPPSS
jgi:hypothetical protein